MQILGKKLEYIWNKEGHFCDKIVFRLGYKLKHTVISNSLQLLKVLLNSQLLYRVKIVQI